jgi:hypothetical protein
MFQTELFHQQKYVAVSFFKKKGRFDIRSINKENFYEFNSDSLRGFIETKNVTYSK